MRTETMRYQEGPAPRQAQWEVPVFFSVFVLLIIIGILFNKRKKQVFENLKTFLQGTVSGMAMFGVFKFRGFYKDRPLLIKRTPGQRRTPGWMTITLGDPPYIFDLSVSEEDLIDGTMKAVGLGNDIETGDPIFDKRFKASSETQALAREWLADQGRRDLISSVFNAGAYTLEFIPRGTTISGLLRARSKNPDLEKELSMQNLTVLLGAMDKLCSEEQGERFFKTDVRSPFGGGS